MAEPGLEPGLSHSAAPVFKALFSATAAPSLSIAPLLCCPPNISVITCEHLLRSRNCRCFSHPEKNPVRCILISFSRWRNWVSEEWKWGAGYMKALTQACLTVVPRLFLLRQVTNKYKNAHSSWCWPTYTNSKSWLLIFIYMNWLNQTKKFYDGHILLLLFNLEKGEKNKCYPEADVRAPISPEIAWTNVIIFFQHTTVMVWLRSAKAFISYF